MSGRSSPSLLCPSRPSFNFRVFAVILPHILFSFLFSRFSGFEFMRLNDSVTIDRIPSTIHSPNSYKSRLRGHSFGSPDRVPCSSTCTSHLAHLRASVLLSDPQVRFCFCFFCVCGLLFYLSISILCCSAPTGICCKLLPNRCSRSRSSLCLGALAGQCQRQRQPERQSFHCTVQASGRRSSSHPIPPAQWEVHNVF